MEARRVGRIGIAAAAVIGAERLLVLLEGQNLVGHVLASEIVGEVQLGRRARLRADRRAVELRGAGDARGLLHHKALPVVVDHAREIEAERGVARHGPGGVARKHVHLAGLQRGETVLGVERAIFDLGLVAEDGGGDRLAEIDIDAGPDALVVGVGEAGQAGAHAALHIAPLPDRGERRALGLRGRSRLARLGHGLPLHGLAHRGARPWHEEIERARANQQPEDEREETRQEAGSSGHGSGLFSSPPLPGGVAWVLCFDDMGYPPSTAQTNRIAPRCNA